MDDETTHSSSTLEHVGYAPHHPYVATLRGYVKHCNAVVRDIGHVLSDYETQQDNWTIHYAVDFSEIFNFVLPDVNPERWPLADGWGESSELQFFVLSRFFARQGIILPEPYAVELHAFMESLLAKVYGHASRLFLDAMNELRRVLSGHSAARIKKLALLDRPLTDDETNSTIEFFEAQAPALVAFVRGADLPSIDLLKRLLKRRPFVDLESVAVGAVRGVHHDRVDGIREYLRGHRAALKPQSDYNDALAMEQIRVANEILAKERQKILLVSRSSVMMAASRRFSSRPSDVFIRHPRIFSTAYSPENGHDELSIADLRRRRQSLELFARAGQECLEHLRHILTALETREDPTANAQIIEAEQLLEKMRRDWANVEGMSAAFVRSGEISFDPSAPDESPNAIAHHLLEFLRDDARNVARQARKHIEKLIDDVRRQRDRLGVKLQSAVASQAEYLNVLYPIHFSSKALDEYVEELARHWTVNLDAVSALVEMAATSTEDEFEQLLAMSIGLGILGLWEVSENYAEYALEVGRQQTNSVLHEGYFWHAVCVRKNSSRDETPADSVRRIKKALTELAKATSERKKLASGLLDPRYLKERGALLIEWRQIASSPENDVLRSGRPTPADITDTLNQAWDATDDVKLRAQISNALFYHYIAEEDRQNAEDYRSRLEESLRRYAVVPSFIRDTRVWGDYFLSATPTVEQVDTWLKELDIIYNASDMTPFDKELVQRHRIDVSSRRNQVTKDQAKPLPPIHV